MKGHRTVPSHEHKSFNIMPLGSCRACDDYHERAGVTTEQLETALLEAQGAGALRVLRMLREVNPDRHAQYLVWIEQGILLGEAVDEAMGDWPVPKPGGSGS